MKGRQRLFLALDLSDPQQAIELARRLRGEVGGFKVGLELFTRGGPGLVPELRELGAPVFVDLKLHDIPNTAAGAAAALARLGVSYMTVHALGGAEMIRRAVEAATETAEVEGLPAPTTLAVTVLTSHDDAGLQRLGVSGTCREAAVRLARLAREAGAGGAVCSAQEIEPVRDAFPGGTLFVPGIRPAATGQPGEDDQLRISTPAGALARGADYLVIGRPITRAPDPLQAAREIAHEIDAGVQTR